MSPRKNPIKKYLSTYAEPEANVVKNISCDIQFENTLIIPAFDEDTSFIERLLLRNDHKLLTIIVINEPDNQSNNENNQILVKYLLSIGAILDRKENITFLNIRESYFLLVDRTKQNAIPSKQGVGLARKIAADVAVSLFNSKKLTAPIIHSTDADATLPVDYFLQTNSLNDTNAKTAAYTYDFLHECDDTALGIATKCYEASIRYYQRGLAWSGSEYAYPSIGSCLAFSIVAYCQARGFPKRAGGEDFYLLNKLAKLGDISVLKGNPILLQARASHRVPFGTGPAVSKILALPDNHPFLDYDPEVFKKLKSIHAGLSLLSRLESENMPWHTFFDSDLLPVLKFIGIEQLMRHLNTLDVAQRKRHIRDWFDAFRSLKCVNYLQKFAFPPIPHQAALAKFSLWENQS